MAKLLKLVRNISIVFILSTGIAFAADPVTVVTGIVLKDKIANVVLNGNLAINEIKLVTDKKTGVINLQYPDYQNKNGRVIPQVEILDKNLGEAIRRAIANNQLAQQKPVDITYKIAKISIYRQKASNLKAFTEIVFNGCIKIEARVMESKTGLWIAWPGRKNADGSWSKQFDIVDYSERQKIEQAVIAKYKVVRSEEP